MVSRQMKTPLLTYLEEEMGLSAQAIAIALKNVQFSFQIPVSLWQYGLISLDELNRIWNWVEGATEGDSPLSEQYS